MPEYICPICGYLCMPFKDTLACCLESKIKELEAGITLLAKLMLSDPENAGIEVDKDIPKEFVELRGLAFKFQDAIRGWYSQESRANKGWAKVQELEAEVKRLQFELDIIDNLLARRDALDSEPTRYAKISKAISVARRSGELETSLKQLREGIEKIIRKSFSAGEEWAITYHTWFEPEEKDTEERIQKIINEYFKKLVEKE